MLRIAALVAGALAGFVASLILAVGALEITASSFGGLTVPQLALARYGLIFIANLSLLGAGVTLALPRTGAALLLLSAIAWIGAALSFGHGADIVLIGPPVLGLAAFALAVGADISARRNRDRSSEAAAEAFEPDPYDVAPTPRAYREKTALAAASPTGPRDQLSGIVERDFIPGRLNGKRERAVADERPAFRELETDIEPGPLARFGRGLTGLLSFGLYAAAAGAVVLVVYNIYQRDDGAALVTGPASSETVAAVPSSALEPSSSAPAPALPSSSEPVPVATPVPQVRPPSEPAGVLVQSPTQVAQTRTPASTQVHTQPRVVGEPAPADAATGPVDLEPASSSEEPAIAEAAASSVESSEPTTDAGIDPTLVPPVPATMSPGLAEARKNGGAPLAGSDI
ncbi:MAG: hypothetical protein ABL866_06310 [Devosia sp.]